MTRGFRAARAVGAGALGVALWLAAPDPGGGLMWWVAAALLAGLPHGALDHRLADHTVSWRGWLGQVRFHALYLLAVGLVLAAWWWVPSAGVALLLLSAAWHFGESDLLHLDAAWRPARVVWSRGAVLVLAPLLVHPSTAADLLLAIDAHAIAAALATLPAWLGAGLVVLHLGLLGRATGASPGAGWAWLDAVAVSLLVVGGGPGLGFVLYFVAWHSLDHMSLVARDQGLDLWTGWRTLAADAAPRTAISLVGIVLLALAVDPAHWNRAVLWAIGALTLPHALVVHFALAGPTPRTA